jgi:hypothetical protein
MPTYEKPEVIDYGTLVELTANGSKPNADVPFGNDNTAFSPGPGDGG